MGKPHVISALTDEIAKVSGIIKQLETEISRYQGVLAHLRATLRHFSPEYAVSAIKPRPPRNRNRWFKHGECAAMSLDALRTAQGAVTTREIADQILAAKGFEPTDVLARDYIQKSALKSLNTAHKKGLVQRIGGGRGTATNWTVAD
jgi:hypothetical protein